ncbi:MAG: IS3 family transposase, partial [Pseudomonadota bacterium]
IAMAMAREAPDLLAPCRRPPGTTAIPPDGISRNQPPRPRSSSPARSHARIVDGPPASRRRSSLAIEAAPSTSDPKPSSVPPPQPSITEASRRPAETAQYAADAYRQALAAAGTTPSMSRKGNCLEFKPVRVSGSNPPVEFSRAQNAPMESFFHTLEIERIHHRVYATRDDARRDLFAYIEGFYNSRRLHSGIG